MNDFDTLNSNATFAIPPMASVTLEPATAAVEAVEPAPTDATHKLRDYLDRSMATAGGVAAVLESWANERESWEGAELAASHARLYAILARCYEYYLLMKSEATGKNVRKQLAAGLDLFIRERGLKTLAKTHDMNKVVKAVFGEDRRRVSAYAMALRAALVAGADVEADTDYVPVSELASWITSKGGVEEVRLGSNKEGLSTKERADVAVAAIEDSEPLLTIKPDAKVMPFGTDDVDKKLVLLVTYRPTGELEVHFVVKHDSVVRAALAAYYAEHKEQLSDASPLAERTRPTALAQALVR
jgi:hypothetical protein